MKKSVGVIVSALALCLPAALNAGDSRLSFKATLGPGYTLVGDMNDWRTSRSRYVDQLYALQSDGAIKPIHFGLDVAADVMLRLNDRLAIGLGTGIITVDGGAGRDRISQTGSEEFEDLDSRVRAIPVRLGLAYFIADTAKLRVFVSASAAYYFASVRDWIHIVENAGATWRRLNQDATAGGMGAQGGVGLEIKLGGRLALVFEGIGRIANFGNFEGEAKKINSAGADTVISGTVYIYDADKGGGRSVRTMEVASAFPSAGGFSNIREFKLNLTGFSLRLGLRVSL